MNRFAKGLPAVLATALLAATASGAGFAPKLPESPLDIDPPERPWAKPWHGPPIHGLVITPWAASRDAYAVAQHMPFAFDVVETRDGNQINFDEDTLGRTDHPEFAHTDRRLERLLENRYEVIVLAAVNFGSLPPKLQYQVLRQVVEGAGLVLANQDGSRLGKLKDALVKAPVEGGWPAAVPWDAFELVRSQRVRAYPGVRFQQTTSTRFRQFSSREAFLKTVGRYRVKKGRLAVLDYGRQYAARGGTGLSPAGSYPLDRMIQYDYYISAAAKQIRWAAGRGPPVAIVHVDPGAATVDRGELATAGRVTLAAGAGAPRGCRLRWVVRDLDGDVEARREQELSIPSGRSEHPLGLPPLRTGEHFLDVWLLREGRVVDWGSAHFEVTSAVAVKEVTLDRDALGPGDAIAGTVTFTGGVGASTCRLRVVDSYRRLERDEPVRLAAGQTECRFRFELPHPVGIVFRLEAWLETAGQVISEGRTEFTIARSLTEDRFYAILWGGMQGPGAMGPLVFREAKRYGYDACLSGFPNERTVRAAAMADLLTVPYMIRLMSCDGREHCFTSPEWRNEMAQGLAAHAAMVARYGALGYSLGDEVRLEDRVICETPTCRQAFRDYLAKTYGSLAALNAEWNTDFGAWDQIDPGYVEHARASGDFAPWMDYQRHRRDLWVDACRWCADAIHRGDPGARMGYEGARGFERWPELLDFFRLAGPYDKFDNDIVVDEHRPGTILGNWIGSYGANVEDSWIRYMSWRRLLLGFNSQWWWTQKLAFNGDGTPVRRFAADVDALAELNSGLGKLLAGGTFLHDPVAIPYCPASELASQIYSSETSIEGAKDAARAILHDLSLHHWRVPMEKIADGQLAARGVRVLFLPYHQAMSRREADGICRFVEQGGTLVADLRPAVMDEHGRPLEEGFLDAVFGIRRKAPAASDAVRGVPKAGGPAAALAKARIELTADRSVELAGAVALGTIGDAPICISRRAGRGRAVLLNFALQDYLTLRETERHRPLESLFAGLLAQSGVVAEVRVTAANKPLDGLWLTRWQVGPALVAGIDRRPVAPARDGTLTAEVHWPRTGEVYDVRGGRHLGRQQETRIELDVHVPRLLAWLPYQIGPLSVDGPEAAAPGSDVKVAVQLQGVAGTHVVCLDVFDPRGTRRVYFRRRLRLEDGRAATVFPLALNARPGTWRVRAREVVSGQTVWHDVAVASP